MSFVAHKGNRQWVWLALDVGNREIVGVYIGARFGSGSTSTMAVIACGSTGFGAVAYTDFWQADAKVLPSSRHRAVGKQTGKTSYIEQFNNTRKTSSVSASAKNLVVFQITGQSHWSHLVLCSRLQGIITCLALPHCIKC